MFRKWASAGPGATSGRSAPLPGARRAWSKPQPKELEDVDAFLLMMQQLGTGSALSSYSCEPVHGPCSTIGPERPTMVTKRAEEALMERT